MFPGAAAVRPKRRSNGCRGASLPPMMEAAADSAADPFMPDVIVIIHRPGKHAVKAAASRSDLFATRARTLFT